MDRALDYLGELERQDNRIANEISTLDEFAREARTLRSRGEEATTFLERLPAERERVSSEVGEAGRELAEAESAHERAQSELATAEEDGNEVRLASARRFERRTRDMVAVAERRRDHAHEAKRDLDQNAALIENEVPQLIGRAERLNRQLTGRARVSAEFAESSPDSLGDVAPWARQAQAAILVARGGLATERDAVVRQANEIGSAILGESIGAASASTVARRVEFASGQSG